jgi:hypothetical protein
MTEKLEATLGPKVDYLVISIGKSHSPTLRVNTACIPHTAQLNCTIGPVSLYCTNIELFLVQHKFKTGLYTYYIAVTDTCACLEEKYFGQTRRRHTYTNNLYYYILCIKDDITSVYQSMTQQPFMCLGVP